MRMIVNKFLRFILGGVFMGLAWCVTGVLSYVSVVLGEKPASLLVGSRSFRLARKQSVEKSCVVDDLSEMPIAASGYHTQTLELFGLMYRRVQPLEGNYFLVGFEVLVVTQFREKRGSRLFI